MLTYFSGFWATFYCLIITPPLNFQNSCLKRGGLLLSPKIYFEFSKYFLLGTSTPPLLSPGVSFEIAVPIVLSNFHCILFHFCCFLLTHLCIKHGTRATNWIYVTIIIGKTYDESEVIIPDVPTLSRFSPKQWKAI